jgi:hypothetical protein
MTQAEWDKKHKDYKTTRAVDATATHARHRVRHAMTTDYKHGCSFYGKTEPNVSLPRPAGDHHSKQQLLLGLMHFGGKLPSTKITVTYCLGVEGWLVGSKVGIWPR